MTTLTPNRPGTRPVNDGWLWLVLALPVLVWGGHFLAAFFLPELNCVWSWFTFNLLGLQGVRVVLIALTAPALATFAASIALAIALRRRLANVEGEETASKLERQRFMADVALVMNGLFLVGLAWAIFPILFVQTCPD